MKASRPYEETLADILLTPEDMTAYLNEAMEDGDPRVFLLALKDVVRLQGVSRVSRKAGVNRQSLYKVLSGKRNPLVVTLNKLLMPLTCAWRWKRRHHECSHMGTEARLMAGPGVARLKARRGFFILCEPMG